MVVVLVLQLPWKSLASIVQFYYMWKTTDRYIQQVWGASRGGLGGLMEVWGVLWGWRSCRRFGERGWGP